MVDIEKEYPVKLRIATLQLEDNAYWRTLSKEAKRSRFVDHILPKFCDLHLTTEDLEYLHKSIDFIFDAREISYDKVFNSVSIEFIIRFRHEKDILFWTMYCKDPKARGQLIKD